MSYDYDYLVIDWDNDSFFIVVGGSQYDYSIEEHGDLLYGGLEQGVDYEEVSHVEEEEDYED